MSFSEKEKDILRNVAKDAIEGVLFGRKSESSKMTQALKQKAGAFVTLKKHGELRGCIGYTKPILPVHETVRNVAIQSAFNDPRFPEVEKNEWKDIDIEVSVLTPMKKIKNIDEIQVGVHGLYIEQGLRSGLLLPQVATEYEWDRETFLEFTCLKAGLQRDAWKSKGINICIFSAEIF